MRAIKTISQKVGNEETGSDILIDKILSKIKIAMPAQIINFNGNSASVQPLIKAKVRDKHGNVTNRLLPIIEDVPVHQYKGGGWAVTIPVKEKDECLLIFSSWDFSSWFQNGGIQNQQHLMRHCISSAYALVGISSEVNAVKDFNFNGLEIRNLTNTTKITLTDEDITLKSKTVNILADSVNIGNKTIIDGKDFVTHTHEKGYQGNPTGGVI